MVRYRVLPYRQGSASARALADALGGKVLKLVGSKYIQASGDIFINWGNALSHPSLEGATPVCLNWPTAIKKASNKLLFFNMMQEIKPELIPQFWTNKEDIPDDAYPVVCRTVLAGHSGVGIVIANNLDELVDCSLYVKYVKKTDEYRIHVGKKGEAYEIIAIQRKARRIECETPNWQVRNHANGFVFVRQNVNPPVSILDAARQALEASGLDFGAIDLIWNDKKEKPYVLEINTAPGLEGQTVTDYAEFFKSCV